MFSNCLIEALKAKILHPFTTEIIFVSKKYNSLNHFMWLDKKTNTIKHFRKDVNNNNFIFFKGHIRETSFEVYERAILNRLVQYNVSHTEIIKVAKKLKLECYKKAGWTNYIKGYSEVLPSIEGGKPFTKDEPYVQVLYYKDDKPYTEYVKIDGFQVPSERFKWRYYSPFNEEYNVLNFTFDKFEDSEW